MIKQNSYQKPSIDIFKCQFSNLLCASSDTGATTDNFNNSEVNMDNLI